MRLVILVLLAGLASAQQGEDARSLLQSISESGRNLKSWRIEGTMTLEMHDGGVQVRTEAPMKMAFRVPNYARTEIPSGPLSMLMVCDGRNLWLYQPGLKRYARTPLTDADACSFSMGSGQRLLEGLESAVVVGRDVVQFQGVPNPCEVVRAKYSRLPVFVTAAGSGPKFVAAPGTRTLCVDRARNLILRDDIVAKITSGPLAAQGVEVQCTFVPTSVERDPELPPELFEFEPPEGSHLSVPLKDAFAVTLPVGAYRIGGGVSAPVVISRREAAYTPEAREARIQGTVALRVVIGADGIPRDVVVIRSLDPGLDRQAMSAAEAWRFRPGMKDGKPVAVLVIIEMNFRLSDRPPGYPVERPEPRR